MDSKCILEYENGKFYSYDGELYTRTFPHKWAKNHLKNTGPKECQICAKYGSWNGVFVAYCINCAKIYNMDDVSRGNGVYIYETMHEVVYDKYNPRSAFDTYLYGIDFDDIGDKCMLDSEQKYKITENTDKIDLVLNIKISSSFDYNNNIDLPHS